MFKMLMIIFALGQQGWTMETRPMPGEYVTFQECQQAAREVAEEYGLPENVGLACVRMPDNARDA